MIGGGLAHIIALGDTVGVGLLLVTSAVASSVTDNIPLAAMLAKESSDRPESCQAILDVLVEGLRDETLEALSQPLVRKSEPDPEGGLFNNFFKMLGR